MQASTIYVEVDQQRCVRIGRAADRGERVWEGTRERTHTEPAFPCHPCRPMSPRSCASPSLFSHGVSDPTYQEGALPHEGLVQGPGEWTMDHGSIGDSPRVAAVIATPARFA